MSGDHRSGGDSTKFQGSDKSGLGLLIGTTQARNVNEPETWAEKTGFV